MNKLFVLLALLTISTAVRADILINPQIVVNDQSQGGGHIHVCTLTPFNRLCPNYVLHGAPQRLMQAT